MSAPATGVSASPPSRAGRNLPVAVGVGVALALVVLGTLYTVKATFVVVVAVATSIAVHELATSVRSAGVQVPTVLLVAGNVVILLAAYVDGPDTLAAAFVLTVLAVAVARLGHGPQGLTRDLSVAAFIVTWVSLLAAFAMVMLAEPDGPDRIVVFILAVVLSDTGGYLAGVLFGRHRMAPRVSPKKSWEGLAGSILLATAGTALVMPLLLDTPAWQGALFGAVVVVTATLGDLGESLVKRDLGVKDMGRLLPEHGGLMDRLDSLLPTAPVAAVLFVALLA
jgi:phosphatidate cytidylyltransferase